ncbi:DUF2070 family protein [Archaeoglobus veneficus]|uniref:DUF2070 domain-containing protein n=1 Tax=Archaeoglobus veneficus (strain DSM 11195 / SNP6) TaxID=693661 RepID=F2KNU4_ARCVS|nr:DUF2070 family protein [Archaeoglobus veneficus]AEA47421.1 Protein of unknown function DUF2070, membrane [Archaeoglobus veneficus SNP6]
MIDKKLMEKFYSKIFTIPRKRISVSLGVITILLASILNGIVSKAFFAQRYFFIGLALIVLLLAISRFIGLAFNSRRVFFLALLLLIFIEVFDFVAIHLSLFELIVLAPASIATLLTLVLFFTSEAGERRIVAGVILMLLALYPVNYMYSFSTPHRTLSYTIASFAGVMLGLAYIKYLDRDYGVFNTKHLLKSFILFWLTSKPEYFEKRLEKAGEKRKGWVKCLKVGNARLISTSFHPGPMRNVGGARLVSRILEIPDTMYLHSATKHELNPATLKDVDRIVKSISCDAAESITIDKVYRPFEVEGERFSLKVFPFEDVSLLIFSGKNATDDIPTGINSIAERYFGEVMLVEAHNAHMEDFDVSAEDFYELEELIRTACSIPREESNLEYCFFKERCETNNICGWIALLLLKYDSEVHGILMLDGNNVVKEFRHRLEKFAEERGVRLTVVSTDNHSKTGISPKVGYNPVGSNKEDEKAVFSFMERALSDAKFKKADISYGRREVEITVMGKRFFENVEKAFIQLGEKALYLFWAMIAVQIVLTILLGIEVLEIM